MADHGSTVRHRCQAEVDIDATAALAATRTKSHVACAALVKLVSSHFQIEFNQAIKLHSQTRHTPYRFSYLTLALRTRRTNGCFWSGPH